MTRKKPLTFGDQESIARAKCTYHLPATADVSMIAKVEIERTPTGASVRSISPVEGAEFERILINEIIPSLGLKGATVYERDPSGFTPYTDLVYVQEDWRTSPVYYLIAASY